MSFPKCETNESTVRFFYYNYDKNYSNDYCTKLNLGFYTIYFTLKQAISNS
mgnify:CR=1 FL=1